MNKMSNYLPRLTKWLLFAAVITLILSGCGVIKTMWASSDSFDNDKPAKPHAGEDAFGRQVADQFGLMAWFSEVAYRRDLIGKEEQSTACNYLTDEQVIDWGMPEPTDYGQWQRWVPEKKKEKEEDIPACIFKDGLFYETYVYMRKEDGKPEQAAITFRGTENDNGQFFEDWGANLSSFFGFESKQYKIARTTLPKVVRELVHENSEIEIYAVGHSLGGGLAQQMGYQFQEVSAVYTFNTSPVTNWTNLRLNACDDNGEWKENGEADNVNCVAVDYPTIYRIYHTGEVLSKVRNLSTTFTTSRYGRYDLGVQFQSKTSFEGHSIQILACGFADIIYRDDSRCNGAQHHYEIDYIKNGVLPSAACSNYVKAMAPDLAAIKECVP
jgi:hypothetical protein